MSINRVGLFGATDQQGTSTMKEPLMKGGKNDNYTLSAQQHGHGKNKGPKISLSQGGLNSTANSDEAASYEQRASMISDIPEASSQDSGQSGRDNNNNNRGAVPLMVNNGNFDRGGSIIHQYRSESESKTRFNNQTSILMCTVTGLKENEYFIMVNHETRIYYFYTSNKDNIENCTKLDALCDKLTDIYLHLLTTTKYRILGAFYLLFQMIDRIALIVLFLNLFVSEWVIEKRELKDTMSKYWPLFIILFVELFYDLMEYNVKIWILNRISIYVGIMLFIAYAIAFWVYGFFDNKIDFIFYFVRLFAFIVDECVDFCTDLEMEFDIQNEWISRMKPIYDWHFGGGNVEDHHSRRFYLPRNLKYVGSRCVWTWVNTFKVDKATFRNELATEQERNRFNQVLANLDNGNNDNNNNNNNDDDMNNGSLLKVRNNAASVMSVATAETGVARLMMDENIDKIYNHRELPCVTSIDQITKDKKFHCHRLCLYVALSLSLIPGFPLITFGVLLMFVFGVIKSIFSCACDKRKWENTIFYEMWAENSF